MDKETNNSTEFRALQTATAPIVQSVQKISALQGGFTEAGGSLDSYDYFGSSMAAIGDLNGDGVPDLAVGAWGDGDGGDRRGAAYVIFMNTDGTVMSSYQKASSFCHTATVPYYHPIMK
jgi:hypothetical protein